MIPFPYNCAGYMSVILYANFQELMQHSQHLVRSEVFTSAFQNLVTSAILLHTAVVWASAYQLPS